MKKPNSYFGNKTATVTKKSSAITTHITQATKHCVWLGHGKMGVLSHYSINKNGEKIGAIKCTFRIKYSKSLSKILCTLWKRKNCPCLTTLEYMHIDTGI